MMRGTDKKRLRNGILKTIGRMSIAEFRKAGRYHNAKLHIATALCICCFIDAMGKYVFGGKADERKFRRFIKKFMPTFYMELIEKAAKEKETNQKKYLSQFYKDVRCGLVHEYFPKSKTGISSKKRKDNNIVFGNKGELWICLPNLKAEWEKAFREAIKHI